MEQEQRNGANQVEPVPIRGLHVTGMGVYHCITDNLTKHL